MDLELNLDQIKIIEKFEGFDDQFLNDLCGFRTENGHVETQENISSRLYRNMQKSIADNTAAVSPNTRANKEHQILKDYDKEIKVLMGELIQSQNFLDDLQQKYNSVSQKTNSLHEACNQLMTDQTNLSSNADELRLRLVYFEKVDQIYQKLQSPMLSVTGEAFMQILRTIDESLLFLKQQTSYKEGSDYIDRCNDCLSIALNKLKMHVCNVINKATESVLTKMDPSSSNRNEDTFTLFYGVFGTFATSLKSLMENIEPRQEDNEEYRSILNDCYAHYFEKREQLIGPSVRSSIEQLKSSNSGSCLLVRSGCSFLLRLCDDEFHLYNKFFTLPTDLFHDYLEKLCRIFYDVVRPIVIHAPHFETLAELCSILKFEMLDERCNLDPEIYAGFIRVIDELSGDATERLVYRAEIYGRNDIQNYKPSAGDLAYPEKLKMMQAITKNINDQKETDENRTRKVSTSSVASSIAGQEVASINAFANHVLTAADLHGLWYPTVKRTVLCLSKLFRCLESSVFQSLSEDIISICIQSLISAADQISANKGAVNGKLFIIKHLLIIREQTTPFRGSCSVKEASVDLSKIKDSAWTLFHNKTRWFTLANNAFLEFLLQAPANVEDLIIDSRRTLDQQLKEACQGLIQACTQELIKSIEDFIGKAESVKCNTTSSALVSLKQHPFANVQIVQNLVNEAYKTLRNNVPTWKALFSIYINNKETENILFSPIKKNTEMVINQLRQIIVDNYTEEEIQAIGFPSSEEVSMLLI